MTGEMLRSDVTREAYPLHFAIARALHGRVEPFDMYQGPYVVIGADIRVGASPYAMPVQHLGIVRLWVGSADDNSDMATVYNEATDKVSAPFWPYGPLATRHACKAARSVL